MDLGMEGKVAAITGGSVGIGLAIAQGLAEEGVNLAICARDEERVNRVAKTIVDACGVKAIGIRADVSKAEDADRFAAEIENVFGGADLLINNAGTGSEETILTASDEKWQVSLGPACDGSCPVFKSIVAPDAIPGGCVILNNASICAAQPRDYEPIYNVTKAALVMFSKCLANEMIQYNIRVNMVNPGLVMTADWQKTAKLLTQGKDIIGTNTWIK